MAETMIVQTESGPVRGTRRDGTKNTTFYSFHQIPYAQPPVGELRFKAPQKIGAWTEVRDCTKQGPIALQAVITEMPPTGIPESEDCLYVNVYKKVLPDADRKLPVMVMLHGGGFVMGSSNEAMYGPEYLLEHDILYVSVNYRLGAFGFLSLPDEKFDIPGNAGLKDQSLALRWVKENCVHFGGDADNITIFGISAGGASVHYHLISDHSKDLFHRAIVQSGSGLNSWANRPHNDGLNERLARALGWSGEGGPEAAYATIIQASTADIAKHQQSVTRQDLQSGLLFTFVPTVEPYDNGTCFIDRDLVTMNRTAWSNSIPIMIGGCTAEGYMFYANYVKDKTMFDDNGFFENALPRELNLPVDSAERRRLGESLRRFYYGDEKPSMENVDTYAELLNEKQFWHGIYAVVKARIANASAAPTYLYNFDYTSANLSFMHMMMVGRHIPEAIHGEDILYQFRVQSFQDALPADSVEVRVRENYNELCTSFAATGKPVSQATALVDWKPVQGPAPFQCLNIGVESTIIELPNTKRLQFWDSLCDY